MATTAVTVYGKYGTDGKRITIHDDGSIRTADSWRREIGLPEVVRTCGDIDRSAADLLETGVTGGTFDWASMPDHAWKRTMLLTEAVYSRIDDPAKAERLIALVAARYPEA